MLEEEEEYERRADKLFAREKGERAILASDMVGNTRGERNSDVDRRGEQEKDGDEIID